VISNETRHKVAEIIDHYDGSGKFAAQALAQAGLLVDGKHVETDDDE